MNNFAYKLIIITVALFSTLLITSLINAEDEQIIAEPQGALEETAPAVTTSIIIEDKKESLKKLVLEPGASCITASCHTGMEKKKYVHEIGVDGMKCSRCHETKTEGSHDFKKIPAEMMYLCAQCHRADVLPPKDVKKSPPQVISEDKARKLHKPFAEGRCTACHDAHSSNYSRHLKLSFPEGMYASYQEDTYALCASCHKDLEKKLTEPRTMELTMFRNGNVNLHYRHVNKNKGRTCKACHHPHGLDKARLLRDTFQFGNRRLTVDYEKTETGGMCSTTCHRVAKYDRYKPELNYIRTEPLPGEQATKEELEQSRKADLKQLEEKAINTDSDKQNNNIRSNENQEDL
jgi:predicted CXXCH cytochrome family protein